MIKITDLCVSYGDKTVYSGFNLDIEDGKITCVLGESGCGKTTLLNAVAGLIPYSGIITPLTSSYVFQSPRLIPYISVLKNLTVTGANADEAQKILQSVGLGEKLSSRPNELSGGEAQRVALCRAFLLKAQLLLMDEPFSSLDLKTKLSVMKLFKKMQREEGRTALFVTHDIDEAIYLADEIVILGGGKIISRFDNAGSGGFGANSPLREEIVKAFLAE